MANFVSWDDKEQSGFANGEGGQFLRLQANQKYKIRFVFDAVEYRQVYDPIFYRTPHIDKKTGQVLDPLMIDGLVKEIKLKYACWVLHRDDGNKLKIMDFPGTLRDQIVEWKINTGKNPGGPDGVDWIIRLEAPPNDKRRTKYKATPLDAAPFTEEELQLIKSGDLKKRLVDMRKPNTPDEIRAMLAAKSKNTVSGNSKEEESNSLTESESEKPSSPPPSAGAKPKVTSDDIDW